MFCTKCGAQLEDGAKFCTGCGAPTRFAQVPAPEAAAAPAAPAQPVPPAAQTPPQAPAQPAAPQQPQWQQPAAPQQPQQPQWQQQPQQQWQQPAQPSQPSQQQWQQQQARWQQQQPQQWQQIQQQWQQQQQARQPQQQWQQPQQQWQQPARGGDYAAPKKKGKGALIGIIAAVLVVAVGVGGFVWPGFLKKGKGGAGGSSSGPASAISMAMAEKFSTPEEFYQTVETRNADQLTGHVVSAYDNLFLSNASSEDIGAAGKLTVEPGDKVRELVRDALGEQLDEINPGDDLKWLKSFTVTYDINRKDDLAGVNALLQLNGTDLAHISAVANLTDGNVWLSVPELSDKYLQTTLEDLNLDDLPLPSSSGMLGSVLGGVEAEDAEKLDPIIDALPDAKTVEKIMQKYLNEAVECIEEAEKESGKLETEGVSADYTVLTTTITPDAMVKIVEKIGPELKEDKDIKDTFLAVAQAAGEEGETKYKEFTDKIDELLNDHSKITEKMTENTVMTVYVDKSGDVHGRVIDTGKQQLEILMPESGGKFGLTVRYVDDGEEKFLLNGSGKRSGDKLTGDLDLTYEGEYYAVIGLDGFDIEKFKDGYFIGGVELRPTASLWNVLKEKATDSDGESKIPESVMSLLESMVFRFDLDTAKDKGNIKLTITNGSEKFLVIALDGTKGAAKKIATAEGVEPNDWAQDVTLDKLEKVVASIEKAGVPQAYTDKLDEALDNAFN